MEENTESGMAEEDASYERNAAHTIQDLLNALVADLKNLDSSLLSAEVLKDQGVVCDFRNQPCTFDLRLTKADGAQTQIKSEVKHVLKEKIVLKGVTESSERYETYFSVSVNHVEPPKEEPWKAVLTRIMGIVVVTLLISGAFVLISNLLVSCVSTHHACVATIQDGGQTNLIFSVEQTQSQKWRWLDGGRKD